MQTVLRGLGISVLALAITGCIDTDSSASMSENGETLGQASDGNPVSETTAVAFDPENEVLPFPNNLLFEAGAEADSDFDGTLNVPLDDPDSESAALINAVNALDGFSTIGSWRLAFTGPVDEGTLSPAVRVFRLDMGEAPDHASRIRPEALSGELVEGEDYELDYRPGTDELRIIPSTPLGYNEYYTVVVTDDLKDPQGNTVSSPLQWEVALGSSQVESWCPDDEPYSPDSDKPDRALLQCMTHFAVDPVVSDPATGLDRDDLVMGWGITTQREDITFEALADSMVDELGSLHDSKDSLLTLFDAGSAELEEGELPLLQDVKRGLGDDDSGPRTPGGNARVFPGVIHLPYYLAEPADGMLDRITQTEGGERINDGEPLADDSAIGSHWSCNGESCNTDSNRNAGEPSLPEWQHTQAVQTVLALPDGEQADVPDGPYPVVIFQHAIQQDRSNALAIADELAQQGYAAMGIDMPLHGIVPHMLDPEDESTEGRISLFAPALNEAIDETEEMFDSRPLPVHYERHFYLNLLAEDEYAEDFAKEDYSDDDPNHQQYIDKAVDASGQHFLVPDTPLSQRDILRQGALDLVSLAHYLRNGWFKQTCLLQDDSNLLESTWDTLTGDSGVFENDDLAVLRESLLDDSGLVDNCTVNLSEELDTNELHFASHSLSNVVAAPFLAYDGEISTVSHLLPLGGIMRTLEASETVGPLLREGLAEAGLSPGDEDYYRFFTLVQGALDAVEPLNLADQIATDAGGDERPLYLSQVLGNEGSEPNPQDLVLPAEVEGWPLAGSNPLARQLGADFRPNALDGSDGTVDLDTQNSDGTEGPLQAAVGFRFGSHALPLLEISQDEDPRDNGQDQFDIPHGPEVHQEMQRQLGSFIANDGQSIEAVETDFLETRN